MSLSAKKRGEIHRTDSAMPCGEIRYCGMALVLGVLFFSQAAVQAEEPEDAWTVLNKHTVELVQQGRYEEAFANAQKATAQARVRFGLNHLTTAKAMNNLANLYAARGNFVASQDLYEKVLKIETEQLGAEASALGDTLFNLARIHWMNKDAAGAKPLLERALGIKTKNSLQETPEVKNIRDLLTQVKNA